MRSKAAFAVAILALSGCALIKNGTTQRVKFESVPPKAEVWVNGVKHPEPTPTTIELPRKETSYEIKLAGYDKVANKLTTKTSSYFYWSFLGGVITTMLDWLTGSWQEFDIPPEDKDTIKVVLEPSVDNSEHIVRISSNPPGASIAVEGFELQEVTGIESRPARINVKWKGPNDVERTITLRYVGYETAKLRLRRGERKLHKNLDPSPITQVLQFESDPQGAEVLIDGISTGITPFTTRYIRPIGDDRAKKVVIRKDGYETALESIKDKNNRTIVVKLTETLETLAVKVDCVPAGSSLEVDGKPAGAGPTEIKLSWSVTVRSHKLRVSRPGYDSVEKIIDHGSKSEPVVFRLKPSLPDFP